MSVHSQKHKEVCSLKTTGFAQVLVQVRESFFGNLDCLGNARRASQSFDVLALKLGMQDDEYTNLIWKNPCTVWSFKKNVYEDHQYNSLWQRKVCFVTGGIQNQLSISQQRTQHLISGKCDEGLGLIFVFITLSWVKRRILFFTVINTDQDIGPLVIMFIHTPIGKYFTALFMCCVLMMGHLIYK